VIRIYEADPAKRRSGAALGCAYARAGPPEEAEKVFAATTEISRVQILACLGDKAAFSKPWIATPRLGLFESAGF